MKRISLILTLLAMLAGFDIGAAEQSGVEGVVTAVTPDYGNIDTDIRVEDLAGLGLSRGDTIHVAFGDKSYPVYLGTSYADVPEGDWVALVNPLGKIRIARNLDNAAKTLGVKEGDTIKLYK